MSLSKEDFERLIAEGVIPEWCRPNDYERMTELLGIMETRELTDEEAEEFFAASSGQAPPKEDQERFNREVFAKIEAREQETRVIKRMLNIFERKGN